ncbi:unnamed protein product [Phyllotreta striolata]|uniref:3'-5' exonuclease domain-containing protein n=1 Tax=Phyllotreta striolata TaxID=444603 RepID=A0A9N9TYL1_PHYSR|nr:unnamed protein product [Phyllotreta striolata]
MDPESFKEQFIVGDYIVIELTSDDIFEGEIADLASSRIDLKNPKQHNNDNELSGIYTFYRNEIVSIKKFKNEVKEKASDSLLSQLEVNFSGLEIVESEYDRLKDMTRDFVYIENADSRYFDAVNVISKAETIGVAGLGIEKCRGGSIKLLAICTWDQVYLFDFINVKQKKFYAELKEVFEAECTCKVIHEAGPLLDILYRGYDVFVKNVFDTQVVDLIIKKKETGKIPVSLQSVSDLLTDYLKFPSPYLEKAMATTINKWSERPLSTRRRTYASQLVAYLITLKEHMQRVLFGEIYEAIEKVHDFYFYLDGYNFEKSWQDKLVPKQIQNLIPNLRRNPIERDTIVKTMSPTPSLVDNPQ